MNESASKPGGVVAEANRMNEQEQLRKRAKKRGPAVKEVQSIQARFRRFHEANPEGVEEHSRFQLVDPAEWWTKQGVSDDAVARMRPGGPLWRDMTEDVGGGSKWVLLGVA